MAEETHEIHVMAVKVLQGKKFVVLKARGGWEALAWGSLDEAKIKGQDCVAVVRPPSKDGDSPTLLRLALKETGEVVFVDTKPDRSSSPRGSDPLERASIEAQSALGHTLQEFRMARDVLVPIVTTLKPGPAGEDWDKALAWVMQNWTPTADAVRAYREEHHGELASALAKVRGANIPAQVSEPASRSKGTAGGKQAAASGQDPAPPATGGVLPPGADESPADPSAGSDPSSKAELQAAVLKRFTNMAGVKARALEVLGREATPSQLTVDDLRRLLAGGEAA